jgi:hypothetical protein
MMSRIWARIKSEPAMVAAVINSLIAIGAERGFALSASEQAFLFVLVSLGLGVAVRQQVEPLSKASPAGQAQAELEP